MTGTKFDTKKLDGVNDFALWQVRMKAFLEQQGLATALELSAATIAAYDNVIQKKAFSALIFCSGDLAAIDTTISDEDQALLLLVSLPSSYDNFMETLLYGRDTLKLQDVRGRSCQKDMEQVTNSAWSKSQVRSSRLRCYVCQSEENLKRGCPRYNHKKSQGFVRNEDQVSGSGANGYDNADAMMAMSVDELLH
ncbi:hypothetical protein Tco_1273129 [Tanacetum coccineum]